MSKKKILVVDDEKNIVKVLKVRLEKNNYEVITASNGKEALQKAEMEQPDLITLDVLMPGIDGYKACSILKKNEKTSHIPVIMLTVKTSERAKTAAIDSGASSYIAKPYESGELISLIANTLDAISTL